MATEEQMTTNTSIDIDTSGNAGDTKTLTLETEGTYNDRDININIKIQDNYVEGTQTSSTYQWTGELPDGVDDYYNGLSILYYLPYSATGSSVTLNLSEKGAKPVYRGDMPSARVTTQFIAKSIIHMTYVINSNVNSGNGGWITSAYKDTNTTYTNYSALENSTTYSLCTRGEKYTWNNKMDKVNPTGTGSLSLNRLANSTVGTNSVTVGTDNTASGNDCFSEGNTNISSGFASHSEGWETSATANCSHAEGNATSANGNCSHAEGSGTIASSENQHVSGTYNIEDTENMYAEIIGGGEDGDNRANIRTLDWSGNEVLSGSLTATNYNGKWCDTTHDLGTNNTTDTWVPVLKSGVLQHRVIPTWIAGTSLKNMSSPSNCGYSNATDDALKIPTLNMLSYWNGAYNSNNTSNLTYCANGTIIGTNNLKTYGLVYGGTNVISSTTNDTTDNWAKLPSGIYWFTATGKLNGQPSQYGILLHLLNSATGGDIFQIWHSQANGDMYYRGGNFASLSTKWYKVLTERTGSYSFTLAKPTQKCYNTSYYLYSVPLPNADKYTITLGDLRVEGVGVGNLDPSKVSIESKNAYGFRIKDTDTNGAGYPLTVNYTLS